MLRLLLFCVLLSLPGYCQDFLYDSKAYYNDHSDPEDSITTDGTCYFLKQALRHKPLVRALSVREFGFEKLGKQLAALPQLVNLKVLTITTAHNARSGDSVYRYNLKMLAHVLPRLKKLEYLLIEAPDSSVLYALEKMTLLRGLCAYNSGNIGALNPFFTNFKNLNHLETLKLSGFYCCNGSISQLTNLKFLSTSFNDPAKGCINPLLIADLTGLCKLHIMEQSYARSSVPENIGQLNTLEELVINASATFPQSIAGLKQLKKLVCRSSVTDFPKQFYPLSSLEDLMIAAPLKEITAELGQCQQLKTIILVDLQRNAKLGFSMKALPQLQELIIDYYYSDSLKNPIDLSLLEHIGHPVELYFRGVDLEPFLNKPVDADHIIRLVIEPHWKNGISYPDEAQLKQIQDKFPSLKISYADGLVEKRIYKP